MNYEVTDCRIPIHALIAGSATGVVTLGIPTSAYAVSLGGVVRNATASPLVMFGVGCAVGAVCGGLVTGLVGRARHKRLEKNVDAALEAASHADGLARKVQDELSELEGTMSFERQRPSESEPEAQASAPKHIATPVAQASAPKHAATSVATGQHASARRTGRVVVPQIETPAEAAIPAEQQAPAREVSVTSDLGRSGRQVSISGVRSILHQRLGTNALNEPLVISKGAEREASATDFVNPHTTANLGLHARSSAINERLPRFDESLFPDTTTEGQTSEEDDFERAMRAMESSMPRPVTQEPYDRVVAPKPVIPPKRAVAPKRPPRSFGEGDSFDASSYVDYLLQDEIEHGKTPAHGGARPYLTVFEGTGDLGAVRTASRRRPKHMARATMEA